MKVFPEVFVVCMAVREASAVFYVLFVSECEGGIGTESRQRGTSSVASVKRAFDNTGTLSTSYTDYTEPLDTETHVPSLKDTPSCHTVDMAQHHLHRDTGNALECHSMGLSSCGRLASVLGFIPVNVRLNHSQVRPLSRLTVSHKNLLSSHHVTLQFCSFRVLILHMCISVKHLSGWHHTLLMRQDEHKDMFNVRSSSPAENVYKQYQLIVPKSCSFTHLVSHLLILLYKLTVFLCIFRECSSQHKHAKPISSNKYSLVFKGSLSLCKKLCPVGYNWRIYKS